MYSVPLVLSWIVGDVPKLIFFIIGNQPIQFVSCAVFQISVDLFILYQINLYSHGTTHGSYKVSVPVYNDDVELITSTK